MKVLVTGGAGYIGSETVRHLDSSGHEVVVLDNLSSGSADAVPGATLIRAEISDTSAVIKSLRSYEIEAVIHFAGVKNVGESVANPSKYWTNNVLGTHSLLTAMTETGVNTIVFSSSCSVYGNPSSLPVNEKSELSPQSPYAESKLLCERLMSWHGLTQGLSFANLRYFNAAGASSDGKFGEDWSYSQNLIPIAMKSGLGVGPSLRIFGADFPTPDGSGVRDYVHVEDLATAHLAALDYLRRGGANVTLNLGTGRGSSVFDVLRAIEAVHGKPVPYEIVARRPGDPAVVYADVSLAAHVLQWRATRGLNQIIESAYRWYTNQRRSRD